MKNMKWIKLSLSLFFNKTNYLSLLIDRILALLMFCYFVYFWLFEFGFYQFILSVGVDIGEILIVF